MNKHHWAILIPVLNQFQAKRLPKGCKHKTNTDFFFILKFSHQLPVFVVYNSTICHSGVLVSCKHNATKTAAEETNGPYCSKPLWSTFWPLSHFELSKSIIFHIIEIAALLKDSIQVQAHLLLLFLSLFTTELKTSIYVLFNVASANKPESFSSMTAPSEQGDHK